MPANIPDDNAKAGSGAVKIPEASNDLWSLYLEEANERAKAKADLWNGSLGAFLLFAGLFAGVVSSFVIDSRAGLQPAPAARVPATTVAINFLWYSSLTFTLISALAAVLAQTWIVKFSLVPTKGFTGAKERWIHDDKAERWNLHGAVAYITVLIQLALFLFLAGLAVQAVVDRKTLGWTILSLVGTTGMLYIGITVLPWFSPTTPFRTPFSDLNRQNDNLYISDDLSTPRNQVVNGAKNRPIDALIDAKDRAIGGWIGAAERTIDAGRSIRSTLQNLVETPPDDHVRQGICWAILKNSSNNESIHAAVVELTAKDALTSGSPSLIQRRKRLLEFGLPAELCNRLEDLAHLPAGWNLADVERMKDYLHMIMWMVDGRKSEDKTRDKLVFAFLPLLNPDGALLNLDALPPACRALAFAVRIHLLVNRRSEANTQPTDWNALVDSLEPDFALAVFRAAIRGLGRGSHSDNLRQDCARMLAVYIGSTRFSIETPPPVVSPTSGDDDLRLTRRQQEPDPPIKSFLKHLEEHWKISMCTRAIQLLEEGKMAGSQVLSSLAQNEKFRGAIKGMFSKVIGLLSHPEERVRSTALRLSDQMGQETLVINRIEQDVIGDLESSSWRVRVAGLQTLTELIRTAKLPSAIVTKAMPGIMTCVEFPDEDVQLAVIRTLQELARHGWFQHIDDNMPVIITLVADDDTSVREAVVVFLAEIARKTELKTAINRNIPAIVTNNFKAETWYIRRNGLRALGKFMETDDDLYVAAINNAFSDIFGWLSDPEEDVREAALQTISLGLKRETYFPTIKNVIPKITEMFNDSDEDVRISALHTFSAIAQIQQAAVFKDAISNAQVVSQIIAALSNASWRTQIAMLQTISTLAQTESFFGIVNDTTIEEILGHLSNDDPDVRTQVLDTLGGLASKDLFHSRIKTVVGRILPLLEDWSWRVQEASLRTFAVFAEHEIFLASDTDIVSRIISLLSGGDIDVCAGVLKILFIAAKKGVTPAIYPKISVVKDSLVHENWRVRVAGLQVLESLSDNPSHERIDLPTQEILDCLSNRVEELQVAGLRTLLKFIDDNTFREQVHVTVSKTLPEIISSLLTSNSEDIRLSVIRIISDLVTKAEFYSAIDATMADVVKLLNNSTDEETRVTILNTVRSLANTEKFCQTSVAFVEAIQNIFKTPFLSDLQTDVRMATFEIIPAISKRNEFRQVVAGSLPVLVITARKDDGIGAVEEYDAMFRIKALQTLADLGTQETFCGMIATQMSGHYMLGAKDKNWPARVAFLKLMWTLGRAELKTAVDEVVVDIIDVLQDDENSVRMAGVQFLNIPVVKETSLNPVKLVPTLVNLLSDSSSEEDVHTAVLQILFDLGKQDKFRDVMNRALPALLDDLNWNDMYKRVAALKIWAALAQDETFRDIINSAAAKLATCLQDPEDSVRLSALATFAQFSQLEAFRLAVIEAAPNILSALEGSAWNTRVQVIKNLAKLAENDAFAEIINGFLPRVVDSLKDTDDDVRFEVLDMLLKLIQQDMYRISIRGALQAAEISTIVGLMSDPFKHVRIGALRLLPKVIELDPPLDPTTNIHSNLLELLSDDDSDVCIAALEAISILALQDANSTLEIPRLIQLLKSENLDHKMCSAVLCTLSVSIKRTACVETAMDAIPIIFSVFMDAQDEECRAAAAQVILGLASQGKPVYDAILAFLASTLIHADWHVCVSGLNVLSDLIKQEILVAEISSNIPLVLSLLEHSEEDVRVSASRVAVSLGESQMELKEKANVAIQGVWSKTFTELENARPKNTDPSIFVAALEKLAKFADYDWLPEDTEFARVVPPIIAAVKDQSRSIQLSGLRALSKLADNAKFRESLGPVVPKMTPLLLSNKRSDTQILLEVLGNFLKFAQHQQFRSIIKKEVPYIISVLDDREPKVRVAGLSVLFKVAQELEADKLPDRLKSTMPHLLTLLENLNTRKDAVALIACLVKDKTLRAELLSKMLPLIRDGPPKLIWGHLLLISRLLEDERLELETSDLRFILCLITSKQTEVQDFVLKFMTTSLQHYLEKWITASAFPPSLSAIFAMPKN
ncbi:armadillo-type protein [Mycena capillaripes]|nr:armadillo-type protein [Mycena capillaripes]